MVVVERVRQIKSGEAELKKTVCDIVMRAPGSTIASLYKYKMPLIKAAKVAATKEYQDTLDAWEIVKTRKTERANVMTGSVEDLKNRIKDAVSMGQIPVDRMGLILEQYEQTQGGTIDFIYLDDDRTVIF
jgi:hypothetical protein